MRVYLSGGEEELGSVGVLASVGHGEDTSASVLQGEVLISKLLAVDAASTSAVVVLVDHITERNTGNRFSTATNEQNSKVVQHSSAVDTHGEVSTLAHESRNHTVEDGVLESESVLACNGPPP